MDEATLVLTRYNEPDVDVFDLMRELGTQTAPFKLIFYDQSPSETVRQQVTQQGGIYKVIPEMSLGRIRNMGIEEASSDIVIFTDIDVVPTKQWIDELTRSIRSDAMIGVAGGQISLRFETSTILTKSSSIIRSLYGEFNPASHSMEVPKVYGGCFAMHKGRLGSDAYMDKRLGRQKGKLIGGEETDLCLRCKAKDLKVIYNPRARVYHKIPAEKTRIFWITKGMYYKGVTAALRNNNRPSSNPSLKPKLLDLFIFHILLLPYSFGLVAGTLRKHLWRSAY